jgi:prephenate dehydrogenase
MPVQISLIGLGQIGASIGLALAGQKDSIFRVGHDRDIGAERLAEKQGAIDKGNHNLPSAVREARLVVLCLPLAEVHKTLELIAAELQEGTVVVDTSPVKSQVAAWAGTLLPPGRHYVGLVPALNPEALHRRTDQTERASADLFRKGVFIVDAPLGTPEEAVTLACNFVELLGATTMLSDPLESDGLMASTHVLPQLTAAALLNATVDQPGWEDGRKIASRPFADVTAGMANNDEIESLGMAIMQTRESVLHGLDRIVAALKGLRDDVERGDSASLHQRLEAAREGRERWLNERHAADWTERTAPPLDAPSFADRLFGRGIARPRRRS